MNDDTNKQVIKHHIKKVCQTSARSSLAISNAVLLNFSTLFFFGAGGHSFTGLVSDLIGLPQAICSWFVSAIFDDREHEASCGDSGVPLISQ